MKKVVLCAVIATLTIALHAQEVSNDSILTVIRKQANEHSQVADIASWITDVYGPRLTGSPMLDKATAWATKTLTSWGLANVHLEEWGPFGRGWELEHFEMHATSNGGYWPVLAYPKAWSAPVTGEGDVIYLNARTEEDLKTYEGKLAGKFVLLDTIREISEPFDPLAERHDAESLLKLANRPLPTPRPRRDFARNRSGFDFNNAVWTMFDKERPLAVLDRSYKGDYGTVFVQGARVAEGNVRDSNKYVVPQITLSVEQYNRILRLLDKGFVTRLSVDLQAHYTNDDGMEHNIIAEIPGTDLAEQVVMFGAHFDSWHTGTGATDNGVGSAVMMEVARILQETIKETGVRPRRTLRIGLWTGEEQGIYGSKAYVGAHYADLPENSYSYAPQGMKPGNTELSAYYNLDNGTGKIRGIYLQGNDQVSNLFREWLDPFENDGASTVSLSNTGGTDHLPFAGAGIPAFQFIQEPMAYGTRTHHSNMDVWDHLVQDDMKQAAMIIAWFVWNTSQRDEPLLRKAAETEER